MAVLAGLHALMTSAGGASDQCALWHLPGSAGWLLAACLGVAFAPYCITLSFYACVSTASQGMQSCLCVPDCTISTCVCVQ